LAQIRMFRFIFNIFGKRLQIGSLVSGRVFFVLKWAQQITYFTYFFFWLPTSLGLMVWFCAICDFPFVPASQGVPWSLCWSCLPRQGILCLVRFIIEYRIQFFWTLSFMFMGVPWEQQRGGNLACEKYHCRVKCWWVWVELLLL
jgi:hypothetical protein